MRFYLGCLCAGAMLAIGCGDDGTNTPTPGYPGSDVKGTIVDIHVTETGDVPFSPGPMQFEIAALTSGEGGAPKEIFAGIANDGTFVIPHVPEGPYVLRFVEFSGAVALPPRYIVNAPREIDLGRVYVGRPDATPITTGPTNLALTTTDLHPWTDGDILELFSAGSSAAGELAPTDGKFPMAMATSLTDYRVDTSELLIPFLVEGDKGDTAFITQLAGTAGTTAPYHSVRKVFEPSSFTQADGEETKLTGAFTDVPQKNLALDIDVDAFSALVKAVHPQATVAGKNVHVIAEPGGSRATTSLTPNLLTCEALSKAGLPASFSYGNPFPSAWAEVVSADVSFSVTHVAPTGVPKSTIVTIGQNGPVGSLASPAVPLISPPLDIQINGMSAQDTLTGVGFTPTLTFTPPAIGTPAAYIVAIRRLDPGGSTTRTTAIFSTTDTTLQIPEGLLDFGYYYYFRVSVRATFDMNQPFKSGTTNAYASALTGVVTP